MPEMNRDEIVKLEALYASNPEGRVFTHLAEAYRKAGEFDRARSILEQGLAKHPAYASAHVVLGRVYADLNDIPQARASFRHVLELDPHNLVALRSLGELARSAGNTEEALGYFQELQHQEPGNDDVARIIAALKRAPVAQAEPEAAASAEPPTEAVSAQAPAEAATEVPSAEGTAEPQTTEAVVFEKTGQIEGSFEEPSFPREPAPEVGVPEADVTPETAEPPAPEVTAASPAPAAAADTMEALPGFEAVQPDYGDLVSPDIDLGWTAGVEAAAEEALPGDLADFATQAETAAAEELPEFDVSDLARTEEEVTYETLESVQLPEPEPPIWAQVEGTLPDESLADIQPEPVFEPPADADIPAEPLAGPVAGTPPADVPPWAEPVTPAAEDAEDSPPDDLVTETMAELLIGQGLHEAAADVFRALIRERPWDPDLKKRLAEVEALTQPTAHASAPEAEPARQAEPERLPFLATAPEAAEPGGEAEPERRSPWTSAPAATTSAATPYAWADDTVAESEEEGQPITAYFRTLLSWRPGAGAHPLPERAAEPEPEPEMANFEPTPATAEQPAILDLNPPAIDDAAGADQLMPWEVAEPPAQVLAPSPPPAKKNENPVEAAFDEWFNSADAGAAQEGGAGAEGDGEDDDDLEMFRSWLQSLKK